jgi:hypothetical protein
LQALLFLWEAFHLGGVIQISKSEEMHPSLGEFDLEFSRAIIPDFSSRECCVVFCVLSNPVEDLLFTILVEGRMPSSLPRFVQPIREGRLDTESSTVECSQENPGTEAL